MSILIWSIPLGIFILCIAYICGYIYGTKHGIDVGIEMTVDRIVGNQVQAARELGLEDELNKILVKGKEIIDSKHE